LTRRAPGLTVEVAQSRPETIPAERLRMHREYHPEDMHHLRAHAFGDDDHHHEHDRQHPGSHRGLFVLTALLGILLAADLLLGWVGLPAYRKPWGVPLVWIAAILGAARIVYNAIEALAAGRIGADFALAQACLAAIILREPFVAAEVVLIALVGEALEAITADRAMRAIAHLFDRTPRHARVRRDGVEMDVPIGSVQVGDRVIVAAGEKVAVDGSIVAGRSAIDESSLTGESVPVDRGPGEAVYAGTLNQHGQIEVVAEKVGHETTLGQVMRLVADAQRRKAPLQRQADRYARWFLPVVEGVAALTLLVGYLRGWPDVWQRAVAVLVVACPCALVLATPAAILASIAWLARHGIVVKGGAAIERLAECDALALDKTGTLTRGRPELASIVSLSDRSDGELLALAATAEASSRHPIAVALRAEAAARGLQAAGVLEATTLPGSGVSARWQGTAEGATREVLVGNRRLMEEHGVPLVPAVAEGLDRLDAQGETPLMVAVDGHVVGLVGVRDPARPEAHDVIHELKHLGFREIVILTGDRPGAAQVVAKRTHIKAVQAELRPDEKAAWIRERQESGSRILMLGDGINDAPALATAHVGIALGGIGSDLAAEAGDIVILGEPLRNLPDLVRLSRQTVAILRQNILGFAFGLNALAMGLAFLGILGPIPAAILHQAGSLLVLLNSMRLLAFGDWQHLPPVRGLRSVGRSIARLDAKFDPVAIQQAVWSRRHGLTIGAALIALGAWISTGWTEIGPDEVGLLRRLGRFRGVLGPGLHVLLPAPLDRVDRVRPGAIRSVEIGYRAAWSDGPGSTLGWEASHDRGSTAFAEDEALVLTGDGQMVEMSAVVQYRVDPRPEALRRFAFGSAGTTDALRPLAEAVVRHVASRLSFDELLTAGRKRAENEATDLLRKRVGDYGLGLEIVALSFQDVHPPRPVVEAYRDVAKAEHDRQARINQGLAYQGEKLATAKGQAAADRLSAEGRREGDLARASAEADAFRVQGEARRTAAPLTDHRLYWDQLERSLAGKVKVILDPSRASRQHLVLPATSGELVPSLPLLAPTQADQP
jgi:Cu+-exporting ATPase